MNFHFAKMCSKFILMLIFFIGCVAIVNTEDPFQPLDKNLVDRNCLRCLCQASSFCDPSSKICSKDHGCGIFRITEMYWQDAGRFTVAGEDEDAEDAFNNCALDEECATRTVQSYMKNYNQDCNDDGMINCYDYAAIHNFGGNGCNQNLTVIYYKRLNGCLQSLNKY